MIEQTFLIYKLYCNSLLPFYSNAIKRLRHKRRKINERESGHGAYIKNIKRKIKR